MQIQPKNKYLQSNNTSFGALKKVHCEWGAKRSNSFECHNLEKRIIKELKDLAERNKFFKENDVSARVNVGEVVLESKPVPKNIFDRVKILFVKSKVYSLEDYHPCPDDSSYFIARKLRNIKDGKERFSDVFVKDWFNLL